MSQFAKKKKAVEDFAKLAMCCDGEAELVFEPIAYDHYIEINDSRRGKIRVSWMRVCEGE